MVKNGIKKLLANFLMVLMLPPLSDSLTSYIYLLENKEVYNSNDGLTWTKDECTQFQMERFRY